MNKQNLFLGGALVLIGVVAGSLSLGKTPVQVLNQIPALSNLGAVSTLDAVDNPYVSIGGVKTTFLVRQMQATSSVPCSFKNPYAATSTLLGFTADITTNGIATAQIVDVATSSTALASSTPAFIYASAVGASAKRSLAWNGGGPAMTATLVGPLADGNDGAIVGPSEFVNFRIATATPGTFSSYFTGTCRAVFRAGN